MVMKTTTKQTYKIFWEHAKKQKNLLVLMYLVVFLAVVSLAIIPPLLYRDFFNFLIESTSSKEDIEHLVKIILLLLGVNFFGNCMWRVAEYTNNRFQPRAMVSVAQASFSYLQKHSYRFFINNFAGALVRRINRLVDSFEVVTDKIYWDLWPLFIRTTLVLVILFSINTTIGWILLIWIVIYTSVNYAFTIYKLKYDKELAEVDSEITANLADTITNNINIKLSPSLKRERSRFQSVNEKWRKKAVFNWDLGTYINMFQGTTMILLEFLIFYFSIKFWAEGKLTAGDFVLFQAYIGQLLMNLWDFSRVIRDLYKYLANAEEMVEILNTPQEVKDVSDARELVVKEGAVHFDHIRFSYHEDRDVIHDLDLSLAPGEKIGVVGPSGAGKSTLVGLIFRLYDLKGGKILIDGQNIAEVTQDSLRENISLVPQDPILFHRTLLENIRYNKPDATEEEVLAASKAAHCDEFIQSLPQKYDTYVGERGVKLSGGERQRVAIARAILKNAPILVLDEATSSLDSESEMFIQDGLEKLMEGRTTIVIAHRLSTIMKMDRIIVVDNGKIKEIGTHRELLNKSGSLYKKLWKLQAGGFIE